MADAMIQKVCVQPSSGFPAATGKKMAEGSDAGPGVSPSTGASAADPIAAGSHDKENWPAGGVRTCSRRRSPLPSWYQRTPLRDMTTIVRTMESRRQEKGSLSAVKPPVAEIEDEGIGELAWSPSAPVSSCSCLHIFIDEATPVAATEGRYSVPGIAAHRMIQATITDCDDKGCRKSTEKLNFGKLKKDLPAKTARRSSLMRMR
ncbi:unnamed protein product [Victoria cruziana]